MYPQTVHATYVTLPSHLVPCFGKKRGLLGDAPGPVASFPPSASSEDNAVNPFCADLPNLQRQFLAKARAALLSQWHRTCRENVVGVGGPLAIRATAALAPADFGGCTPTDQSRGVWRAYVPGYS